MEHGQSGASGQPAALSVPTGAVVSAWLLHLRTEAVTAVGHYLTPRTALMGCACRVSHQAYRALEALGELWSQVRDPATPAQPAVESSPQGLCPAPTFVISSAPCPHHLFATLSLSSVSLSFPLFPLTDKRTLSDPKSHRKSHFIAALFPLVIPGSPCLALPGVGCRAGREDVLPY
jgi:hypothetical protein